MQLKWWLRVVGTLYVLNGAMMAIVKAPISAAGPEGALERAASGDPTSRFLVDTWIGFGLEVCAVGVGLLAASRSPASARVLAWTVIGIELTRGISYDIYMLASGYPLNVYAPWILIHGLVIVTGLVALRRPS